MDKDSYSYLSDARGLVSRLFDANMSGGHMAEYGNTSSPSTPMTYDAAGNRLSMLVSEPANGGYGGTTNYSYDYKDELTTEQTSRNGGKTTSYAYDLAGNNTPGQVNSDNEFSDSGYTYDGNGNPTSYFNHPATYDAENRLTSFNGNGSGSSGMSAGYDGMTGLRVWRTQGGATVYYVYDGDDPVVELSVSGMTLNLVALNTFGDNGLISRSTGTAATNKHFYSFDPEGSPAVIYDGTGAQVAAADTSAFGTLTYTGNFNSDPYAGFGSQWGYYTDWGTGLELLGHRYYDPNAGRFINRDPTGYEGGINLYEYSDNDPTTYYDPTGFDTGWAGVPGEGPYGHGNTDDTLVPGQYACKSIPARGPERNWNSEEIASNNANGDESGCHTCGAKSPGTKSGNWIPDHQPPNSLNPNKGPQRLYPHCINCMRKQGGDVNKRKNYPSPPEPPLPPEPISAPSSSEGGSGDGGGEGPIEPGYPGSKPGVAGGGGYGPWQPGEESI